MLRFQPDSWLEGLSRPLVMLDPVAGTYFEIAAPDLRPFALLLLLPLALWRGRLRQWTVAQTWRLPVTLVAVLYLWTFVVGNGRYFLPGLLLSGPLLLWSIRALKATALFRGALAALVILLQVGLVSTNYMAGQWSVLEWQDGPGLPLPPHPAREKPAVMLTVSHMSHSWLVPQFHPESRWSNVAGQRDIVPGVPEYQRLRAMLESPLPRFLIAPVVWSQADEQDQPTGGAHALMRRTLAQHGLSLKPSGCEILRTHVALAEAAASQARSGGRLAYWLCAIEPGMAPSVPDQPPTSPYDDVFGRIEALCPRLFPPGGGVLRFAGATPMRHYTGTDMRVLVFDDQHVAFKHFRAINPSLIGTLDEVRQGRAVLDCDKIPGRYVPPWNRD